VFLHIALATQKHANEFYSYFVNRSGKCIERWSLTDSISLLAQLGVNTIPY